VAFVRLVVSEINLGPAAAVATATATAVAAAAQSTSPMGTVIAGSSAAALEPAKKGARNAAAAAAAASAAASGGAVVAGVRQMQLGSGAACSMVLQRIRNLMEGHADAEMVSVTPSSSSQPY
jgi:hypothetical protein